MLDSITRQPVLSRLSPLTVARISVGFALITALWLAVASVHGEVIALIAAGAVVICGHLSRVLAGLRPGTVVEWGVAGCGVLAECLVYTGMAAAVALHASAAGPVSRARSAAPSWRDSAAPGSPARGGWRSPPSSSPR